MESKHQNLKVIKVLGRGAFGEVKLVQNEMGMEFALKNVNIGDKNEIDVAHQEAMFLFKLNHKNIIRFQQAFTDNHGLSILMEYADGGSLYDKLVESHKKGEHLEEVQILKWTGQLASALHYLHKKNIIHRDIKPQNVLLNSEETLKLADLGISKILESTVASAHTFAGTKAYMSPEILDEGVYDCKTDIWSMGVMLYQLLTFQIPFNKVSDQIKGTYIPLPDTISPVFHGLIKRTLEVDPHKRATAKEIKAQIKEFHLVKNSSVDPPKSTSIQHISDTMTTLRIGGLSTTASLDTIINFQSASASTMVKVAEEIKTPKKKATEEAKTSKKKVVVETKTVKKKVVETKIVKKKIIVETKTVKKKGAEEVKTSNMRVIEEVKSSKKKVKEEV